MTTMKQVEKMIRLNEERLKNNEAQKNWLLRCLKRDKELLHKLQSEAKQREA